MSSPRPELRVLVVGAAGYVGGELLRLLLQHPQVGPSGLSALSRSHAGQPIAAAHPTLAPLTDGHFVHGDLAELATRSDVVLLALPHGDSARLMADLLAADPRLVLDLAADFRIADLALYESFYGPHPAPALLPQFVYGLADIVGTKLRGARAIAVPGCFATAAQLALYPLRELLGEVTPSLFAVTGSSGAGSKPQPTTHHPARASNLFAYAPLGHRHQAEIQQSWRAWTGRPDANARLLSHSGPFVRGIYLTLHASLADPLPDGIAEHAFAHAYRDRPLVRLLAQPPELTHAVGSSYALIHATQSSDGRELQVMVAIDNLLKGAAGQAVQAMNLALGLPESAGLTSIGAFPW
jgi:N-acetyl-gamma-glutamyl-phosphate reductase common form